MIFVVPPELGFGNEGVPGRVPPAATLFYDVQLESVKLVKFYGALKSTSYFFFALRLNIPLYLLLEFLIIMLDKFFDHNDDKIPQKTTYVHFLHQ